MDTKIVVSELQFELAICQVNSFPILGSKPVTSHKLSVEGSINVAVFGLPIVQYELVTEADSKPCNSTFASQTICGVVEPPTTSILVTLTSSVATQLPLITVQRKVDVVTGKLRTHVSLSFQLSMVIKPPLIFVQ